MIIDVAANSTGFIIAGRHRVEIYQWGTMQPMGSIDTATDVIECAEVNEQQTLIFLVLKPPKATHKLAMIKMKPPHIDEEE